MNKCNHKRNKVENVGNLYGHATRLRFPVLKLKRQIKAIELNNLLCKAVGPKLQITCIFVLTVLWTPDKLDTHSKIAQRVKVIKL